MDVLKIKPFTKSFDIRLSPPGSKSLTNRALVLAALSERQCRLSNVLFADDTRHMLENLAALGFELQVDPSTNSVAVQGAGGAIPSTSAELFCGNSGTTLRFLAAMCALGNGVYKLDGIERMRQRPIGELVDMLRHLGVAVEYVQQEGFPPIRIHAKGMPGGSLRFGVAQSSQYLSAILMAAPFAKDEVKIDLDTGQTSWPYIAMTMRLMTEFGNLVELERDPATAEPSVIHVPPQPYLGEDYVIEPDASNASYFMAAAAIHRGSRVTIEGLGSNSVQGDVRFAQVLQKMGATAIIDSQTITIAAGRQLRGIDVDLSDMPDTAQTLAAIALFAEGSTTIRGLRTLRVKETDRLAALQTELRKLGATVIIDSDETLQITPPKTITPAAIETYNDHRMAMSFAVAATRAAGVEILDPTCVNKTYPGFFDDLERLRT